MDIFGVHVHKEGNSNQPIDRRGCREVFSIISVYTGSNRASYFEVFLRIPHLRSDCLVGGSQHDRKSARTRAVGHTLVDRPGASLRKNLQSLPRSNSGPCNEYIYPDRGLSFNSHSYGTPLWCSPPRYMSILFFSDFHDHHLRNGSLEVKPTIRRKVPWKRT